MADRTHEVEDERTGGKTSTGAGSGASPTPAAPHVYQEGSVESIRERPTGSDRSDRTGQTGTSRATRAEESGRRDEFISSEVSERTSRPMHDSKTRS